MARKWKHFKRSQATGRLRRGVGAIKPLDKKPVDCLSQKAEAVPTTGSYPVTQELSTSGASVGTWIAYGRAITLASITQT